MDGAVNNFQYWCIDFVKKRKSLELKIADLTKRTEYYKEEFRQYCNKYVSLNLAKNWYFLFALTDLFPSISEWENFVATEAIAVDMVPHRTQ